MRIVDSFPHEIEEQETVWIPMPDGVRLAGRLWLPAGAGQRPVPTILEYIPYRRRDVTRYRDNHNHRYFAGHGYAALRVDLRGSGDSDGVLPDEYLQQELDDGVEILRWIESQPWSDGQVGMIGISWGGFNGLQIAAMEPPQLKAVITVCSTDDRYTDDVHYMGGCLLGDNLSWASSMFAHTSLPPDPDNVGERWRDLWRQRLEGSGLWLDTWLRHQRRDAYWRHGSICEDFSRVNIPVFAVSGWADGYSNAVFRLMEDLPGPRRGLIGPWSHKYPHMGIPGPAIGFLQEAVAWWDHWLKGEDNRAMDEPMLRVWMQDSVPPTTYRATSPGRWVGEPSWPSARVHMTPYSLSRAGVLPEAEAVDVDEPPRSVQSPLSVGLFAGKWCSFTATPDLPHDQREEDGGAIVYTSRPLPEAVEILGAPVVELDLSCDQPQAMVAVRLSDVAENDKATRVTYGLLNLAHRDGHGTPEPLVPGQRYRVRVPLNGIAQGFPKGHRIRVSVSTSYWPVAWPAPRPARLTIHSGSSRLLLPERPPQAGDAELRAFGEPEGAPGVEQTMVEPRNYQWLVTRDLAEDVSTLHVVKDEGVYRIEDIDLEVKVQTVEDYSYRSDDVDSVRGETHCVRRLCRGDWRIETVTHTVLTSNATHFFISATLDAYEGDRRVFSRNWDREIPRDHL